VLELLRAVTGIEAGAGVSLSSSHNAYWVADLPSDALGGAANWALLSLGLSDLLILAEIASQPISLGHFGWLAGLVPFTPASLVRLPPLLPVRGHDPLFILVLVRYV
jgi:hypothetical protein